MTIRESLLENLAGDLEFSPRRAAVYLCLGAAAAFVWISSPSGDKFTLLPVVFGLGSLTLFIKGVFLFRKSSDGFGLSTHGLAVTSETSQRKHERQPASFATQMAQVIQDFGTGPFLLWPLLIFGEDLDHPQILVACTSEFF
ncbi:MAG: hypothetical protein ACRD40_04745 [Candidatus Acidiferrales bacterium]